MPAPIRLLALMLVSVVAVEGVALAQESPPPATGNATVEVTPPVEKPAMTPAEAATAIPAPMPQALTLMDMVQHGGWVLWVIGALGFVGTVMAVYLLLTVTNRREVPPTLVKRAHAQIRAGDFKSAYQMCEGRDELLAKVLRSGLHMVGHDRYVIQDAMESEGERGAAALWQKISYVNNIATIAPLLGLLGTVWGMMQAFSSIALDDATVKTLSMAYSVSMAMVTTAAGLILAIPLMAVYYYLRGRVVKIVAEVEAEASELVELIAGGKES